MFSEYRQRYILICDVHTYCNFYLLRESLKKIIQDVIGKKTETKFSKIITLAKEM